MTLNKKAIALLALLLSPLFAHADDGKAERAIKAVKELCLAGKQFDLKIDAIGNLTLKKLSPGAEGSISVNVRESTGAAAIFNDKIRQVADEEIRRCIQPHIAKIVDTILEEKPSPAKKG